MTTFHTSTSNKFTPRVRGTIRERFEAKVFYEPNCGCWLWGGDTNGYYGSLSVRENGRQRRILAHRLSYELHRGPIPSGLVIDHKCRMLLCVNPHHLEAVSQAENVSRVPAISRGSKPRLFCAKGHAKVGRNAVYCNDGYVKCRICQAEARRRFRARQRGA